jgi:AcrR family transcriptional regulator
MVRRAESTERTRAAILDAATQIFWEEPSRDLTLDAIALRAGTTVQTVIRHFGGRDGVFEAAVEREMGRVEDERDPAAVSTPREAVRQVVAHYERVGDRAIRLLAEEHRSTTVARLTAQGRAWHRSWCEQVFATTLSALRGSSRRRRLAQLVAVCDVYTWKLLRRDAGLDRRSTELAMFELLAPLLAVRDGPSPCLHLARTRPLVSNGPDPR